METDRGIIALVNEALARGRAVGRKEVEGLWKLWMTPVWTAWPEEEIPMPRLPWPDRIVHYVICLELFGKSLRRAVTISEAERMTPDLLHEITRRMVYDLAMRCFG